MLVDHLLVVEAGVHDLAQEIRLPILGLVERGEDAAVLGDDARELVVLRELETTKEARLLRRGRLRQDGRRDPIGERDDLGLLHAIDRGPYDDRYAMMRPISGLPSSSMPPTLITHGTLAGGTT